MTQKSDGMNYAPKSAKPKPVVGPGEFKFAAAYFDHGHIFGQINGLTEAGGELAMIYERDPAKLKALKEQFPDVPIARDFDEVLQSEVQMVTSAAIPNERGPIGCQVMESGKDYLTDKCPFTTIEQLEIAKATAASTKQKYMVYYSGTRPRRVRVVCRRAHSERRHWRHRAHGNLRAAPPGKPGRPDWFFKKEQYGGILTDIASHQFDQFLHYTRQTEGKIAHATVDNRANPDKPELEDVGQAVLILDNGVQCFSRVNWFTPDGMRGWGDGRTFITGTKGYIEIRKFFRFRPQR